VMAKFKLREIQVTNILKEVRARIAVSIAAEQPLPTAIKNLIFSVFYDHFDLIDRKAKSVKNEPREKWPCSPPLHKPLPTHSDKSGCSIAQTRRTQRSPKPQEH
jgi:hypothetical protein